VGYRTSSQWHYLEYSTEINYEGNEENPITTTTYYGYDNLEHLQLTYTKIERSSKNGDVEDATETFIRYPDDYSVSSLKAIKDRHILIVPIKKETVVNGSQVGGQILTYNSLGQPKTVYKYRATEKKPPMAHNPAEIGYTDYAPESNFTYDEKSNRIKQVEKNGVVQGVYLWGYNNSKPIAEVKNAAIGQVFYTSFEEEGKSIGIAQTGERYLNKGSFTISTTAIPAGTEGLKMSYWYWNGSQWAFSGEVAFNRTINSPGSRLDEIRVYPEGAQMTTYTYNLLEGLSSVTDPNNITTYYTYDAFGRLEYTKDDKGNILRKHEYKYVNR
jgi:YD repeat-containing protein